jgi:hypothetical protein
VAQATAATVLAPAKVPQVGQSTWAERLDQLTSPHTLIWVLLLVLGLAVLAWAVIPELRRRMREPQLGQEPASAIGPHLREPATPDSSVTVRAKERPRFTGGPRQISVQLKASEPSVGRAAVPLAKRSAEAPEVEPKAAAGHPVLTESRYSDESVVGPVIEQPAFAEAPGQQEEIRPGERDETVTTQTVEPVMKEVASEAAPDAQPAMIASEPVRADEAVGDRLEPPVTKKTEEPVIERETVAQPAEMPPVPDESMADEPEIQAQTEPSMRDLVEEVEAGEGDISEAGMLEPEREPVAQGQPVPYQTVIPREEFVEEPAPIEEPAAPAISSEEEMLAVSSAIAGVGALRITQPAAPSSEDLPPQPTTTETMPETLQTPTAPVIRTPAATTQTGQAPPAPQAAAAGVHTAVQITLSCEIASMQLTPTFKMGALQLRPISKIVTMRLASPQQHQAAMNLQVNFEVAKVQPAPGNLGQIRLTPSQQQKPATHNTPSFNISGLQLVSGFEAAPLQLTPSQQGQASVYLTAVFQIVTVEFSPTFEIAAIILNSNSKTVSVQLPGTGTGIENAPVFEMTNVQLSANGEIALLQLNPAARRS